MYTNYSKLRYLVNKILFGGRISIWLLLFQEYDFEVIVNPGKMNVGPYHLSCILSREDARNLDDILPYAHLFVVQMVDAYFENIE
jgi:hypothetical protein